jgi:tetratricopeptide (TPR) repeat protein
MLNGVRRLFSNKRVVAAIRQNADQLRDAGIWGPAGKLYKSYLELRPQDAAIWIQCGHCQKESGLLGDADVSYGRAAAITPNVGDVWLQIGHLRKVQGRISEAAVNYAKALTKEPTLMPAHLELEGLGFAPSDIARLIAEPGSPAAMARLHERNERPSTPASQIEPGQIEEIRARLDEVQERMSTQFSHIDHLLEFSRHIERLLELTSTVKALGFAMKRQEGQAAEAAARLAAVEAKLDRLDRLLTDMPGPARSVADCLGRADFAATNRQVNEFPARPQA